MINMSLNNYTSGSIFLKTPTFKGRCQDQSKIKSRKSIVIKPPFLGVPESEVKGQHELAEGWSDMSWQGTDQG